MTKVAPPMVFLPYRDGGFECSRDPESYAGGSVATGRAPMSDRSRGRSHTKWDTLVLQVGVWE
jgi:hypothetical protein